MRVLRGMKQGHFAALMGVSQSTVSRWERGDLAVSRTRLAAADALLSLPPDPALDAALKRLVQSFSRKVHLICDRTHRLLAVSAPRMADWRIELSELIGRSLLVYASEEILEAEERLARLHWHEGAMAAVTVSTGANRNPRLPIRPGLALWERLLLSDGSAARLVTTLA